MPVKCRLLFAISACLLLSNCGLIGTALRLAPYYLMFADGDGKGVKTSKSLEMRGRQIQDKGRLGIPPAADNVGSSLACKR